MTVVRYSVTDTLHRRLWTIKNIRFTAAAVGDAMTAASACNSTGQRQRYQSPSFASAFASSSAPSTSHHPLHVQNPLHHSHPFGFYPHPQGPSSAATPDAMMKSPQQTPPNEIVAFGGVKRPSSVSSNGTPNGVLGGEQPALKLPRLDQVDEFNKHGSLIGIAVKSENGQILQNPSATPPSAQTPNGHSKTLTSLDCKPPAVTSAETCHPVDPGHRVLPLSSSSSTTPLGRPSSHTALGIGAPGAAFAQQNSSLFVHTSNADARLPPRPMNLVDPRMPHLNMLPFHQLPITNNPFLSASGAGVPFLQAHIASLSQQQQQQLAGVIPSTASAPTSAASTASSLTSASQNPFPQNASLGSQLAGAAVFGHKHLMGNATSSIPQNAGASRKGVWNGRHVKIAETVKANKNSHAELSAASSSSASTSTTPVTSTVNSIVSAPSMVAPPHHQQNAASVSANTSAAMHHAMQFSQHARNPPQNVLGASHPLMAPPLCPPSTSTASISGLTTGIAPGFAMQAAGYPHLAGRSSVTPKRDATLVPSNANPNRPPSTLTRNLVPNAQNAQNLHALAAAGLPSAAAHQLGINLPLAHQLSGSLTNGISDAAAAQAQVQAQAAQAQAQQLALIAALQGQSLPPGALQQLLAASQSNQVAASQAQPAPQTHHPGLAAAAGAAAHPALSFAAAAAANGGHPGLGTNSASALRLMTGADPAQMNSLLLLQQQMEASRANLAASQAQPASLHAAPTNLDVLRMQMEQQQQQHQAQQQQQHQQLAAQVQQQQLMERLSQQHHQNLASQHAAAQQQQQQLAAAAAASAASGGLDINLFRQQFANAQMRMNPLAMSQAGTDRMNLSQASSQLESMLENQRRMLQHQPHQLSQQGLPPGLVGLGANGVSLSGLYGGKMPFAANLEHLSRQQAAQQPKREDLLPNGGSRP
ncbi:hypothetical protein L596_018976 [Steinernema carpocapsae]|uniref:Uncharacterized protein n=1 Tax=Steinernema carpocapsae TaxID=34508 RepID=A0A4U5N694_STECR|nr:hypothetical protein L596_018976 [Steinernema carpocapsae]